MEGSLWKWWKIWQKIWERASSKNWCKNVIHYWKQVSIRSKTRWRFENQWSWFVRQRTLKIEWKNQKVKSLLNYAI